MLQLAAGFIARGHDVDVVVRSSNGPLLAMVPQKARLVDLGTHRMGASIRALRRYFDREQPIACVAALTHVNLLVLAVQATLWKQRAAVVVTEHSHISLPHAEMRFGRRLLLPPLIRLLYPRANSIVAVSEGVASGIRHNLGAAAVVDVVPNPIFLDVLTAQADLEIRDHPWLTDQGPPIILSVGRLSADKAYHVLIRAVAKVCTVQPCRLLILGEGAERTSLERLVAELGLSDIVSIPGFRLNPYPYFRRATLFVLSSIHEGLPTVLLEAMALRLPIVSTDCQSGPSEILAGGRHGILVPIDDPKALAAAIAAALVDPVHAEPDALDPYHADLVIERYVDLLGLSLSSN